MSTTHILSFIQTNKFYLPFGSLLSLASSWLCVFAWCPHSRTAIIQRMASSRTTLTTDTHMLFFQNCIWFLIASLYHLAPLTHRVPFSVVTPFIFSSRRPKYFFNLNLNVTRKTDGIEQPPLWCDKWCGTKWYCRMRCILQSIYLSSTHKISYCARYCISFTARLHADILPEAWDGKPPFIANKAAIQYKSKDIVKYSYHPEKAIKEV